MSELISRQKLIEAIEKIAEEYPYKIAGKPDTYSEYNMAWEYCCDRIIQEIKSQPPADQWIPVTYRETTEEERECGIEWKYILDCPLPDNDTEILVCTKAGSVWTDTFFNDDGCYLDGGYDLTEIAAWQPLPKPYKGVE